MGSGLKVRRAVCEEADALTQLAKSAKASWGYPAEWLQAWEAQLSFSARYLRGHDVFVAELSGKPVGVVAVDEADEPEIAHLWVSPRSQRQGVGRALMKHVEAFGREQGWTSIRIESDPHARPFYERLGAVYEGEVPAPVAGTARTLPLLRLSLAKRPARAR